MGFINKLAGAVFILSLMMIQSSKGQHYYFPLNNEFNTRYDSSLHAPGNNFHTSVKPYISNEVATVTPADSLEVFSMKDSKFRNTWAGRKIFKEHLLEVKGDDFFIYGDPDIEFNVGRSMETGGDENLFINSRGIRVGGTFGERFSFNSSFIESQATYSGYISSQIRKTRVVPGGSRVKNFGSNFDYGTASGTIAYSLKKYFSFQLGHDKNFIGDGYRSMLLSDNTYSYPFLKINATFWKIKYTVLYALFQDGPYITVNDEAFKRKYGTFHYLDVNIGKRLSLGILEAVIWRHDPSRAYDFNYFNPVIFLRPVEFSIGSPDNALIGLNARYRIAKRNILYGQIMLDEFKINEIRADNGWWANKHAMQAGFKSFSVFGISRLDVSSEFNYARPYTYSHRSSLTSYTHFNQALAHPLGANFWESVSSLAYSYKRWNGLVRVSYAMVGYDVDSAGVQVNYGNNPLLSYETRRSEYGNEILQGLETKVINAEVRAWYVLNPKSNLVVESGVRLRNSDNILGNHKTMFVHFGIRTNLTNRYLDF